MSDLMYLLAGVFAGFSLGFFTAALLAAGRDEE